MDIEPNRVNRPALSDAELRAALYFAVGVTSESGDKAYRLVVAGDNPSTPRLEPADSSGYSIGTIQTDLGQHYQPNVRNGENVPRDLVAAYQGWARQHHPDWVLTAAQESQTISDLGRNGRQINAQQGRALDATVKSHLDSFLASDAGITWVHQRDVAQVDKLMREAITPLQRSTVYQNASQDDQIRLAVMVGKAYNQNERVTQPMIDRLERNEYNSVASVREAVGNLFSRPNDYLESGRDKALRGAEVMIALRNAAPENPLSTPWTIARDGALTNPTQLAQAANGDQLSHAYPAIRELFVQYDQAIRFTRALDRGGTFVRAGAQAGDPNRFAGRGLIASGNDFAIWNSAGEGVAFTNDQWRTIERSGLTRTAQRNGVLDVGVNTPLACERLLHVDPNAPALRPERRRASVEHDHKAAIALASFKEHPLYQSAEAAVRQLEANLGRPYDAHSERMTASLTQLARANGLSRIDHVVLSEGVGGRRAGEHVFAVQGGLEDPTHRLASMKTQSAIETSVDQSFQNFRSMEAASQGVVEPQLVQQTHHGMAMS